MPVKRRNVWTAFIICALAVGCQTETETGPSYAELVVIYNAEVEALDRLEAKREKLAQDFAAATSPDTPADAQTQLQGLLESAKDLKDAANEQTAADLESQLDGLVERSGEAQQVANQLLDGLLTGGEASNPPEPTPEEIAAIAEQKAAFEKQLADLDEEIEQQKKRVERAKRDRDEAERE